MEKLKTFIEFVNEALIPSQFRKYVASFNRDRYKDLFQKYKEKYDGDRNAYRIYLPLKIEKRKNQREDLIKKFLEDNGYEIVDYMKGTCKFKTAKNPSKIGSILTKLKAGVDIMRLFVEDPERKKGNNEELMVVISRHPYDIAGSDTDRDWTNCMTMRLTNQHPRIKELKAQLKKAQKSEDYHQEMFFQNKIEEYREHGGNAKYLIHEVEQGSLMSYLIRKDDKNINKPLAVLNIKPYVNKKGEICLNACRREYGTRNQDFKNTVIAWLKEVNQDKTGAFMLNHLVYNDDDLAIIAPMGLTFKDFLETTTRSNANLKNVKSIDCSAKELKNLDGIEKLVNLENFVGQSNKFENLKGIENCKKLKVLYVGTNKLTSLEDLKDLENIETLAVNNNQLENLKGIENLKNLGTLYVGTNKLKSLEEIKNLENLHYFYFDNNQIETLKGIENLTNLIEIFCYNNKLKNLDGIEKLENLRRLECAGCPWEYPLPKALVAKFYIQYTTTNYATFKTYKSQKAFLEKYPKRIAELKVAYIGLNEQIKEEFAHLIKTPKPRVPKTPTTKTRTTKTRTTKTKTEE